MKTYLELAPGCLISFLYVLQNSVLCEGKKTIITNFPDKVIEPMLFIWHPQLTFAALNSQEKNSYTINCMDKNTETEL